MGDRYYDDNEYAAPDGPPPQRYGYGYDQQEQFAPPSGPPPRQ
jgi:hypothetical protein